MRALRWLHSKPMLICSVRDCRLPLKREPRRLFCPSGHSFDVARSGYVNLLQPQERRSKNPGDTVAAVAARRRLHDRGVTAGLLAGIAEFAGAEVSAGDTVLDAGCGDGFYLGSLVAAKRAEGHGVDISAPAVELAAKRYPGCEWIVANADRFTPYADQSFALVMSITGRMNAAEFRRVLRPGGMLLVAIPAPDDLQEVRGEGGKDRVPRTVEAFSGAGGQFVLTRQSRVTTAADLDEAAMGDLLHSIYRPLQATPVTARRVTLSLDLLGFRVVV